MHIHVPIDSQMKYIFRVVCMKETDRLLFLSYSWQFLFSFSVFAEQCGHSCKRKMRLYKLNRLKAWGYIILNNWK